MKNVTSLMMWLLLDFLAVPISILANNDKLEIKSIAQNPDDVRKAKVENVSAFDGINFKALSKSCVLKGPDSNLYFNQKKFSMPFVFKTSSSELPGNYVLTYSSLLSDVASGGRDCIVEVVEGKDSITITNFWDTDIVLRAGIDYSNGKISIPNQIVATTENYGDIDFAYCMPDGTPDRVSPVTASITEDGVIEFDNWWGIYVVSGEDKDSFFGVYSDTRIERANGEMGVTMFDGTDEKYHVIVEQTSFNTVTVKNFANHGKSVEIELSYNETASIPSQLAIEDKTNGDWYTFSATYNDSGELTDYSTLITVNPPTDKRKLEWGNWTMMNIGGAQRYYWAAMTGGYISTDFDIEFPVLSSTEFEGDGTEESPYLIKKADDLILLSNKVNEVTEYPYSNGVSNYARIFLGKYFRLEGDIDMTGYRFQPIGNKWQNVFAGIFDGNGKKLTGLEINTREAGYAALFGICDTLSVIKNLTVDNAKVETYGFYCAGIAGWSRGTIENCNVTNSSFTNSGGLASASIAGIATVILNCHGSNNVIYGLGGFAAGIAGEVDSRIEDCSATATSIFAGTAVEGYPSGGITGQLYYKSTAQRCYFSGSLRAVSENMSLGGLFGSVYMGSVENCFNAGSVLGTGTNSYVGGIVGYLSGTLRNNYNVGRISDLSSRRTGGITGYVSFNTEDDIDYQSTIENCYSIGQVIAETYQYNPDTEFRELLGTIDENATPTISNIYFDKQMVNLNSNNYGVTTAQLTSANGIEGFSSDIWEFKEGYYPQLKVFKDNELSKYSVSSIIFSEGSNSDMVSENATLNALGNTEFMLYKTIEGEGVLSKEGHFCSIVDNILTLSDQFGTDTLFIVNGNESRYFTIKISPVDFEGSGTKENPYLIKTKDDLIELSEITTNHQQYFPDTYFLMTNDIDMEYSTDFKGICVDHDDAKNQFAGIFDGGGFTIHNMYISTVEWTVRPEDAEDGIGTPNSSAGVLYKGFIGRLAPKGILKNLNIAEDCKFEFWASSAALVGYNYGVVDNCRNYADIIGYSMWIGGIVGQNLKGGIVRNCYNEGTIIAGYGNSGGIAGTTAGTIENCMNVGDIYVKSVSNFCKPNSNRLNFAGGICGSSNGSIIKNVINAGKIYAEYSKAGGISGSFDKSDSGDGNNDMINAINYGQVFSNDQNLIGAIAGTNGSEGEITNVFYDGQITVHKAAVNTDYRGMTALVNSELTNGVLDGFSTDIWLFETGKYPVLKQFVDEDIVEKARKTIMLIPAGVTVKDLSQDAELPVMDGLNWELKNGDLFKIENNVLKAPGSVDKIVSDTIVASWDKYIKPIVVRRVPKMPLQGSGTEEDPYLITSADDWISLAGYMTLTSNTFEGQFLRITQDIDFTEKTFVPLANDGLLVFQGNMDGNNKKMSGISYQPSLTDEGLIGTIGLNGIVSDLTISGVIESEMENTAGFCGKLYGKLNNCINEMNITSSVSSVAGICATAYPGSSLTGCINKGTIVGSSTNIAGVVADADYNVTFNLCGNEGKIVNNGSGSYTAGLVASSRPSSYIECYNKGVIELSDAASVSNVAGLIAYANSSSDNDTYIIEKCYNTADVTANAVVAGLIAAGNNYGQYKLIVTDCYNEGAVTSVSEKAVYSSPTAGISCWYTPGSVFTNCSNSGTVLSNNNVYAGGIAGYYLSAGSEDNLYEFVNCINTGEIKALGNQGGGIVAYVANYTHIKDCVNKGNISGGFGLGGIAGCFFGLDAVMENCYNVGSVTTSTYRAGGLIGYNSTQGNVVGCFNLGNVSTTSEIQGTDNESGYAIGGLAGQGGSIFTDCYNMGDVKGVSQVGGLIGYPVKGSTQLISSYNAGRIIAPADTCANLIGVNLENGKLWNESNKVVDTYFVTDYGVFNIGSVTVGTGKTIAELASLDMGDSFVSADDYSLPIIKAFENNEYAKVFSAAVVVLEDDTYDCITGNFKVGAPEGVVWSSSVPNISFKGNDAIFSNEEFEGDAVLTASCGEVQKAVTVHCIKEATAIDSTESSRKILEERYYTVSGTEVSKSVFESDINSVYIIVRKYDDGTTERLKHIK